MEKRARRPRRRHYLIDRKFQLPVALAMAGIGLVMIVYHLAVVHYVVSGARAGAALETRPLATMLPLIAVLVIAFAYLGIHVTHRIVGPAYRLIQTMKALAAGKLDTRAHLRKGDALKDVAAALNELGEALEARCEGHRQLRVDLRRAIERGAGADEILALLDRADEEAELFSADHSEG